METILRVCKRCNFEAKNIDQLKLFVRDKKKIKFYNTKATCKKCNAEVARQKRAGTYEYPDKSLKCKDCGIKPKNKADVEKSFVKDKTMKSGYANLCKPCNSSRVQKHQKDNPEMFKKRLKKYNILKYGISEFQYLNILKDQNESCAICQKHKSSFKRGLYIDHDHLCCPAPKSCGKCVRGLLCASCNFLIGCANDDIKNLNRAIIYLNKGAQN
jgi:hypothetical protein